MHVIGVCWWFHRLPFLQALLGAAVCYRPFVFSRLSAVAGWGGKASYRHASRVATQRGLPCLALEDGFLRSHGTGERFPPLAVSTDDVGVYYDSTRPSRLEQLLAGPEDLLAGVEADVHRAKALILEHGLSKYNHAPSLSADVLRAGDTQRVLVVDQTAGDMSIALGGASAESFTAMLKAALDENPAATVYVKTHPEVSSGRKAGHFAQVQDQARVVVLRQAINPLSLIRQMDKVYVVSSTMGFEALLAGKPVVCFGLPWYAGWGVTQDRLSCPRRTRRRSVDELFAAAYLRHARYLDPVTHQRGSIFNVIGWLRDQKATAARINEAGGRMICVGFRRWKAMNIRPMLSLDPARTIFVRDAAQAGALDLSAKDRLVFWGRTPPAGVEALEQRTGARLVRMEDGFVRSVGLGSDLIRPLSLVLDEEGIYFDPTRPSALEVLLSTGAFSAEELERAKAVRAYIVEHGITKYNLEPRERAPWAGKGQTVVLVPGQVEDDASIRFGCTDVKTNLGLLKAARSAHPDAFIVYKPHPDVLSGNRAGRLALDEARRWADHIEAKLSIVSCIVACDEVHTMTSLTGFDALLRGKRVVTYGQPFYAGWGLTQDKVISGTAFARRQRRLSLDELVTGTLLRYPLYWDWDLKGYTSCEAVLRRLVEQRTALEANGGLDRLRLGFVRRQWRKLGILTRACVCKES